ncbi:unnamed protein product [Cylindrotheca closterium]|uniref:F-box domain-containing protein n=1 Tax=Cylindrotheca closterium TaxID=2856 RepID=A0AAD2JPM4_9STRA|nr:unnamed protein product [Cylindrotheca closterium]
MQYSDPSGLTIDQSPPSRRLQSDDDSNSLTNDELHKHTGVHMYHQNNVMIGNFLHPVDRSNSSRPSYNVKASLLHHNGQGANNVSMAELFLSNESARRRSLEQNYESLGTLLADGGIDTMKRRSKDNNSLGDQKNNGPDASQIEIDDLVAAVDPTPWSEIRRKIQTDEEIARDVAGASSPQRSPAHPHHSNYYPYGRHHQLPIPNNVATARQRMSSPNRQVEKKKDGQSTMEEAIATAAAIACGQKGVTSISRPTITPPPSQVKPPGEPSPYIGALQLQNGKSKFIARPFQRQLGSYSYSQSQHSAAHSTNRASVLAAASRKSQYGFGGNHTVPSVPAPPPVAKRKEMTAQQTHTLPTSQRDHFPPPNCGAAYERKKQRAKDARIKLNEAIESLSIAIGLAGSQSRQRHEFLSSRIVGTVDREKTLRMSAECSKLAEQAKKWDRPSFVGTAASIVQGLNSQCEALMRELVTLNERLDESSPYCAVNESPNSSIQKRNQYSSPGLNNADGHVAKRLRPSPQADDTKKLDPAIQRSKENESNVFGLVKDFLDPISMVRSLSVSRVWRDIGVFSNGDAWFNFAVKRFGFYNVRQWTEKLEDCGKKVSNMSLYKSMNSANVMPHFEKNNLSLIGDSKIPGRVSGWVFIVERSNGETLRSVKTEPAIPASTNGAFQSRPVVELRVLIQNTGTADQPIGIRDQKIAIDVSTRRSGGELNEIDWDSRFKKVVRTLDGETIDCSIKQSRYDTSGDLCHLRLFDSVLIEVYINACGCSTTSKFQQRSNFTKILICLEGTTIPLVIPFLNDHVGK